MRDALDRLRHDLGKYIAFEQRFSGATGGDALRDALVADLLRTRRDPAGDVPATALWASLRPELAAHEPDAPELAELDAAMAVVARVAGALAAGVATDAALAEGRDAASAVADTCRRWWRRHKDD
jgi:hypothetical protein